MPTTLLDIPGYAEAVEAEQLVRDCAFLPVNDDIAGFEVKPFTLRHYVILRTLRSPVLAGALAESEYVPSMADLASFLWLLHPDYSPENLKLRKKFYRRCKHALKSPDDRAKVILAARKYLKESFMDKPASTPTKNFVADYYSDAAALCAALARNYGWDDEAILDKPLKRILQYLNEIRRMNGAKVLFNPSDRIVGDWLAKINESGRNTN